MFNKAFRNNYSDSTLKSKILVLLAIAFSVRTDTSAQLFTLLWLGTYLAKDVLPHSTTGIFTHCYDWVHGQIFGFVDSYHNPSFDPEVKDHSVAYVIHGFSDTGCHLRFLANTLAQQAPDNIKTVRIVSFEKRGQLQSIGAFATQLKKMILTNQDERVILIGYSRGGLVISHFTEHLAHKDNIEVLSVINIVAPFKGSALARPFSWFTCGKRDASIAEMCPNSTYLKSLAASITEEDSRYHYVIAKEDGILPPDSCYPHKTRPQNFHEIPKEGHLSITYSNALANRIIHILNPIKKTEHKGMKLS